MKKDLEKLAACLRELECDISVSDKDRVKSQIMSSIRLSDSLAESEVLAVDPNLKARVKIALLEKIEVVQVGVWSSLRRITSLVAPVVALCFMVVYVLMLDSVVFERSVSAATVITDIRGNVYVIRDGQRIDAYQDMELQERDVVSTGDGGFAAIKFFDDSVSRLSADSELELKKLFSHSKKKTFTVVEVELIRGDVYNRVVNLLDDGGSQFKVKAKKVSTQVSQKAAFNVNTKDDGEVKVEVVRNTVDVVEDDEDSSAEKKVVAEGFRAVVASDLKKTDIEPIQIDNSEGTEEEGRWIAENLVKDEQYIKEIVESNKQERKKLVGSLPDQTLYSVKEIKTGAKLLLTTDEIEKEKLKFEVAHRRLKEAQVLIDEGRIDTAQPILDEFEYQVKDYKNFISTLEGVDPQRALELEVELNDMIDESIKDIEPVLDVAADDPGVKVKEVLVKSNKVKEEVEIEDADEGKQVEGGLNFDSLPLIQHFDDQHPVAKQQSDRLNTLVIKKELETDYEDVEVVAPEVYSLDGINMVEQYLGPEVEAEEVDEEAKDVEDMGVSVIEPQVFTAEGVDLAN